MANYKDLPLSEETREEVLSHYIDIYSESDGSYDVYNPNTQFHKAAQEGTLEQVAQEAVADALYWYPRTGKEEK